jgi:hypothetical protein
MGGETTTQGLSDNSSYVADTNVVRYARKTRIVSFVNSNVISPDDCNSYVTGSSSMSRPSSCRRATRDDVMERVTFWEPITGNVNVRAYTAPIGRIDSSKLDARSNIIAKRELLLSGFSHPS